MYKGVKKVKALPEYKLLLTFEDNIEKIFDLSPYLSKGKFAELKDENLFNTVHVSFDTVEWNNGLDICPETLYHESKSVDTSTANYNK